MKIGVLLAVFCLAVSLLAGCTAQRASDILSRLPGPGSLSTVYYFPNHPTKQFPAGDEIKVVVSAHNDGTKTYNLTAIMGSLNSPMDFDLYIQNFTQTVYFTPLPPGEEMSLEYSFRPDPILSPREFIVALHLIYEDKETGALHSNIVFNSTVDIVEKAKLIDTELLFLYLMLVGTFGLVAWYAYLNISDKMGWSKGKGKKKAKTTTVNKDIDPDEWVKGTAYEVSKRKKAAAKTKAAVTAE